MEKRGTPPRDPAASRGARGDRVSRPFPILVATLLVAAALLFYWPVLVGAPFGKAWFWEDFTEQNYPYRFYQATHMRDGVFPLWNPYIFGGLPFAADVQAAAFYPPNWALALFVRGGELAPEAAEGLQILHAVIGGVFAALFARSLFGSAGGGLFAGIAYAFCAFMVVRMKHGNIVEAAAWIPGVLLFLRSAIGSRSVAAAAIAALLFGISFLAGAPQYSLYCLMAALLLAAHEIFFVGRAERRVASGVARVALFGALGILVAGVAFLPSLELAKETLRTTLTYATASETSFHPKFLATFLLPNFFGTTAGGFTSRYFGGTYYEFWELAAYVGVPTLMLGVLALFRPIDRAARLLAVIGGAGFLLALGRFGPLHPLLFQVLEPYQRFRVPGRAIFLVSLALVLLAARGVARAQGGFFDTKESRGRLRSLTAVMAVLIVAATAAGVAAGPASATPGRIAGAAVALLFVALTHAVLAATASAAGKRRAAWLLAAILAADLAIAGAAYNLGPTHPARAVFGKTSIVEFFRKNLDGDPYRVTIRCPEGILLLRNAGSLLRVATLDGYNQLRLRRSHELMTQGDSNPERFQSLWSVLYRTVAGNERGSLTLAKNPAALPRARLVHGSRAFASDAELLAALSSADWDPSRFVALERDDGERRLGLISDEVLAAEPPARVARFSPDEIVVDIDARAPGFVVLTDPYYPGWEATVDGKPAESLRADYALRAVRVDTGARQVVFRYRPRSVSAGIAATLAGLAIALVLVLRKGSGARAIFAEVFAR
ncbi:MAG: YfhO family protein [bacterium]